MLNLLLRLMVMVDASAGTAMASRVGSGKLRQLEVSQLWVQDNAARKELELRKISGQERPADKLTKYTRMGGVRAAYEKSGAGSKGGEEDCGGVDGAPAEEGEGKGGGKDEGRWQWQFFAHCSH